MQFRLQTYGRKQSLEMETMEQGLGGSGHLSMQPPASCMVTGWIRLEQLARKGARAASWHMPDQRPGDETTRGAGSGHLLCEIKRDVTTAFGIESGRGWTYCDYLVEVQEDGCEDAF